ncbi:MAG TPA: hypothetical protein VMU51_21550 [Mycobacteriales bacterium]|nr:hypothetical protein [Mycobacteriales bacterium]
MRTASETMEALAAECWCCGATFAEPDLVRLGQHPEVGICLGCAQYLYRRRTERLDHTKPSLAAEVRNMIRAVRAAVVARGWADRPVLGRILRRIDRHLP